MRLCIADPPYPPQFGERRDRPDGPIRVYSRSRARRYYGDGPRSGKERPADFHDQAGEWDDPVRHRALLEQLMDEYDGWAIATSADGLHHYAPLPVPARTLVWIKTRPQPTSARVASTFEHVILYPPEGRRARTSAGQVPDVLVAAARQDRFAGAKPTEWTRWVLDCLAYDPDVDELIDLFPGSNSVALAASQAPLFDPYS